MMWRGIQRSSQVCIKPTKSFLINRKNKTRADMETILPLRNDASPLEKWHSLGEKEGVEGRGGKGSKVTAQENMTPSYGLNRAKSPTTMKPAMRSCHTGSSHNMRVT